MDGMDKNKTFLIVGLGLLGGGSPDPDEVRINYNINGSNRFSNLPGESF